MNKKKPTVNIYSVHFNRPDFIKIQMDSFKKFIKNDFNFLIINNSGEKSIEDTCKNLNIDCINLNNDNLGPSVSHSLGLKELGNYIKNDGNIHVILDHDMFIIEDIDFFSYMDNKSIMFIGQTKEDLVYMWPGLIIIDSNLCPNLNTLNLSSGVFNDIYCDSGGGSYKYLLDNPDLNIKNPVEKAEYSDIDDLNTFFFVYDNKFLHYFRGSNWIHMDENKLSDKDLRLKKIIYE